MKRPLLHKNPASRRPGGGTLPSAATLSSCSAVFWFVLHAICCLASLAFGYYSSRLVFYPSPTPTSFLHTTSTITTSVTSTITHTEILTLPFPTPPPPSLAAGNKAEHNRVEESRHGIRIRPWPHPNPAEMMRAHRIIERVQREHRLHYNAPRRSRPFIVVTPTYSRSFQTLHLTGLLHSLLLVPYPLTWLVVEAAAASTPHSNDTAAFLARSGLPFLHIPYSDPMPDSWPNRRLTEIRMRLHALRVVRERRMDGIVVFADESNVHSLELFDEAQKVKWMGAISVGILADAWEQSEAMEEEEENKEVNSPVAVPMQGPACNSSGDLVGWHTTKPPSMMEWAGFVMNSRSLWKEAHGKPDWIRDLDAVGEAGEEILSPLDLLKDASRVEPLGECGRKTLLWWLRLESRSGSEFPPGWTLNPVLEMTEAAKHTPELEEMEVSNESIPSWAKYIAIMKASLIH